MLDVFFQNIVSCVSFTKREFMYSKIAVNFHSFDSNLSVEVCSSIPSLEMYCLLDNPPHKTKKVDTCGTVVEMMELYVYSLHRRVLILILKN
jgi:hypothetical protein